MTLSARGDRLAYAAPPGVLTKELRAELALRKAEVLTALRKRVDWGAWAAAVVRLATVDQHRRDGLLERFEERAGVLEYEANLLRADAERRALEDLLESMGGRV